MKNTSDHEIRCDLAAAHRLAVRDGLNEGVWNHFSVMSPDNPDVMLITPCYTHWSLVNASNLAAIGPDGLPIEEGGTEPTVAGFIIHAPVHKAIPSAKCLMHVHSPYITALSIRKDIWLDTQSSQQAAQFHGDVAYYEVYDGLLNNEDEGRHMAEVMADKRILMMRNHGAMVAGETVGQAYIDLYQLERACMYQVLATGEDCELNQIPEEIAETMASGAKVSPRSDTFFRGLRDLLDRDEPDYVN